MSRLGNHRIMSNDNRRNRLSKTFPQLRLDCRHTNSILVFNMMNTYRSTVILAPNQAYVMTGVVEEQFFHIPGHGKNASAPEHERHSSAE
jgi:hypothetical protein